jgi:hypothetical protein
MSAYGLTAPPQIDETTPRLAFLTSRGPAALLAAKSAHRLSRRYSLRDSFTGLPTVSGRRWMRKT